MRYRFPPHAMTLLAALALTACASASQPDALPKGTALPPPESTASAAPDISVDLMKQMTQRLSADDFEGRAPSTAVEPKVLDYIVAQFKAAGLQPGNHGEWLQTVPTVEITGGGYTPLTVAGGAKPLSFGFGDQYVAASYRVAPQTRIKDSELVFVGYGIDAPELGWNDYAGVDMHGKTAVILVNDPDYANETQEGPFKGRRMTYYGRWTYKFEEAARQGATAALIVHDTFPAAYGWNVVNSSWTGAQYYVQKANDGMDQTAANGWVQKPVAEAILAAAGKDLAALTAAAKQKGFKPVPLGLKASFGFDNAIRKSASHNVVGVLPGKIRPDEYVLYSAHWDHLGRCTPDATGDDICNGAVDNATGVAALTAIAKAETQAGPAERSQVFIALTLEESGLLGSEYYAANPIYPLDHTVGGVNMDALLPAARSRSYAMTGGDKSDLTAIFREALAGEGLAEVPEEHSERGHYYRSDHFSMAKRGVPMFDISRSTDVFEGGKEAGEKIAQDYTDNRYHAPSDEYSESWNWDGIVEDVNLYYRLGRALADSDAWPNWHEGDEFRAIRDKSCAAASGGCHK
ncbi:Zn-dependent amino-or carboxypeptidase, M28 family [Novosphingobium sp. CF614]|uniref:M28 family metallopeptidase n=1 Tax=Novosphingobium sp. CF614 TaxID=1884364 RepID=UPI0008F136DC|nr:M28 family metallopeptidase [Novosphingobium sp. CF614]SFF90748.1 Zn-dependent amino-or carboxypeptidase, M28 family [Novosphingobium sp. CF614]